MIKLTNIAKKILHESELTAKERVKNVITSKRTKSYKNSPEGRLLDKVSKDIISLDGEELKQYIRNNFMDRSNSWKIRLFFGNLLDAFENKKK